MRPTNLRYTPTHEWVRLDGSRATVGITDFAVEHLSDLVYVALPEKGRKVKAGESIAEIESVKAVAEVYAPLDGEIVEVNGGLADAPETITKSPFEDGWIVRLAVAPGADTSKLLDAAAYESHLDASA